MLKRFFRSEDVSSTPSVDLPPAEQRFILPERFFASQQRRLGVIYASYRLGIALLFMFVSSIEMATPLIGGEAPLLYFFATNGYFAVAIIFLLTITISKKTALLQTFFGLVLDVLVLSVILYTSGGPNLQLSMLYLVVVAASFIILPNYQAVLITLLAVIFVIYQQFYSAISHQVSAESLGGVILLSLSFIGVALFSWLISNRLVQTEAIAQRQADEARHLQNINNQVISQLKYGVLVIDDVFRIYLFNQAAATLLNIKLEKYQSLVLSHPMLVTQINDRIDLKQSEFYFGNQGAHQITEPVSIQLKRLENNRTLIIMYSVRRTQSRAQQLKLASLGTLTASIAHEIRNPLAAISQAIQLVQEEQELLLTSQPEASVLPISRTELEANQDLYTIIYNQTKRVNHIVEDVLQLSRGKQANRDRIYIRQWIKSFIDQHYTPDQVELTVNTRAHIYFDPNQLEQILLNLIGNGLRYSERSGIGYVSVQLVDSRSYNNMRPTSDEQLLTIDVIDYGEGIDKETQAQLFEPFFTTEKTGTGLGLYISRMMCEANNASLTYIPFATATCFRIRCQIQ